MPNNRPKAHTHITITQQFLTRVCYLPPQPHTTDTMAEASTTDPIGLPPPPPAPVAAEEASGIPPAQDDTTVGILGGTQSNPQAFKRRNSKASIVRHYCTNALASTLRRGLCSDPWLALLQYLPLRR